MSAGKPKVLFVDDDANIVHGFKLLLRQEFDVHVAQSGSEGLTVLRSHRDVAVVVSDMRMPEMDGADFLGQVKELSPNAIRVLLTGFSNFDAALKAVNEGQIFRFLSKPCPPDELKATLTACINQYELLRSEKVLLDQTLVGCVKVLMDVVGMAVPETQRKAVRIRDRLTRIARQHDLKQRWQLELAACFSQLGYIALLDSEVSVGRAQNLQRVRAANNRVAKLVASIPRLKPVSDMLAGLYTETREDPRAQDKRTRLLVAVSRLDDLLEEGQTEPEAMRTISEEFDTDIAELIQSSTPTSESSQEVLLEAVRPGMVLAEDLRTTDGVLLALEGSELDVYTIDHLHHHRSELASSTLITQH